MDGPHPFEGLITGGTPALFVKLDHSCQHQGKEASGMDMETLMKLCKKTPVTFCDGLPVVEKVIDSHFVKDDDDETHFNGVDLPKQHKHVQESTDEGVATLGKRKRDPVEDEVVDGDRKRTKSGLSLGGLGGLFGWLWSKFDWC